jgi:DNA-binding NtrC family response regulator
MRYGNILAIDSEREIRDLIERRFTLEGFEVRTAGSAEQALKLFDQHNLDVVLLDINLPEMDGIELLRDMKQRHPDTEIIIVTGYSDVRSAVESIKLGARDYLTKPFKLSELIKVVRKAVEERNGHVSDRKPSALTRAEGGDQLIRCPSQGMEEVYELSERVAQTNKTVLLLGETGVGKDVLAIYIHACSPRKNESFVILDCGLINQNLAESELYGHRKGAFSGATEGKMGLVERSQKGTLFLDEIGNLDTECQKKFLRFLETKRFRRVGELRETLLDTRIILATNLDLQKAMREGTLRKDLFYRMDVICIEIPPLRDRPEDIAPLAQHFLRLESHNGKNSSPFKISQEVLEIFTCYPWPGNVRELKSVIDKAMFFAKSNMITPGDLPNVMLGRGPEICSVPRSLKELERDHILSALEETGWNQSRAARILGIDRKTLYRKIHAYELLS